MQLRIRIFGIRYLVFGTTICWQSSRQAHPFSNIFIIFALSPTLYFETSSRALFKHSCGVFKSSLSVISIRLYCAKKSRHIQIKFPHIFMTILLFIMHDHESYLVFWANGTWASSSRFLPTLCLPNMVMTVWYAYAWTPARSSYHKISFHHLYHISIFFRSDIGKGLTQQEAVFESHEKPKDAESNSTFIGRNRDERQ